MNKLKLLAGIFLLVFIVANCGCNKNDDDDDVFLIEIIGEGCGDACPVKFEDDDENRVEKYLEHTNSFYSMFYANNLVEEHKEVGFAGKIRSL